MTCKLYKRFLTDTGGHIAVTFALMAVPLVALTSVGVENMRLVSQKQDVKAALDAAVIAAVNNNAIPLDRKSEYAEEHFRANYSGDTPITLTSEITENRVRLSANGEMELNFGPLVGLDNPKINSSSTGQIATEHTICVLALSEQGNESILFDYDLNFLAPNCSVHSNSRSKVAIVAENPLNTPTARSFCTVGGTTGNFEPASKGECRPIEDPYAKVVPAKETQCVSEFWAETQLQAAPADGEAIPEKKGAARGKGKGKGKNKNGAGNLGQAANNLTTTALDNVTSVTTVAGVDLSFQLPAANPLTLEKLTSELIALHGADKFDDDDDDDDTRRGDRLDKFPDLHGLGGNKLREVIVAYTEYGKTPHCSSANHVAHYECVAWNDTPFQGMPDNQMPSLWLLTDVFELSYGDLYPTPPNAPALVESGIIEEIEGKFYSRNNFDNALVHISSNLTGDKFRLYPGTYCGGLTVDGKNVTFVAGDYIMKDGPLTFLNESASTAKGVTFGFKGRNATLNIETGSKLDIVAPMSGERAGLAFMEIVDADAPGNRARSVLKSRIASGGELNMAGTAYLPTQALQVTGDDSRLGSRSAALGLIADTLEFNGERGSRVEIDIDHRKAGVPPIQPRAEDGARLVE